MRSFGRAPAGLGIAVACVVATSAPAGASHSWGGYHWARKANPSAIQVVDSMTSNWDSHLAAANGDWNKSTKFDNVIVAGDESSKSRKRCAAISGKIRACNAAYGYNGWLGLASISLSGGHIAAATVKQNDSYFQLSSYNTPEARRHVLCQELGHDLGLDHQHRDDVGGGVTCMNDVDRINDPAYVSPNAHDYEQLDAIYGHTDSTTTIASSAGTTRIRSADGRTLVHVRWA